MTKSTKIIENQTLDHQQKVSLIRACFKNRIHYGHHPNQLNPKMTPYLYKNKILKKSYDQQGYYMINVVITSYLLIKAKTMIESLKKDNLNILFIGTKFQLKRVVAQEALRCNQFFINYRWLGGLLTNWNTAKKQISKLEKLEKQYLDGTLSALPVKESNKRFKQLKYLKKCLWGIKDMKQLPDLAIITHQRHDLTAVYECKKLGIPIIGIVDTDCDPDLIDFVIPANDDSTLSVKFILHQLAESVIKLKQVS